MKKFVGTCEDSHGKYYKVASIRFHRFPGLCNVIKTAVYSQIVIPGIKAAVQLTSQVHHALTDPAVTYRIYTARKMISKWVEIYCQKMTRYCRSNQSDE